MADNSHYFHAEAHALAGRLELPFQQEIPKQAFVKLEGRLADLTDEQRTLRNYFSQQSKSYRLEGIISYAAAHTQVSGHESKKYTGASVTLATSVVEDLNILNVVTADRVVAQISTTHFPGHYAPEVTFLGTHFENLKIARHRLEPILNLALAGDKPGGKDLYVRDNSPMVSTVKPRNQKLASWLQALKAEFKGMEVADADGALTRKYDGSDSNYAALIAEASTARDRELEGGSGESSGITCSLVEEIGIEPIRTQNMAAQAEFAEFSRLTHGHAIHIPDFGTIFLAELTVNHNSFHLTMIRAEMGCLVAGSNSIGTCAVNGRGGTSGGGGSKIP